MSLKVVHIAREEIVPDQVKELAAILREKWEAKAKEAARKKFPGVQFDDDEPKKTA